MQLNLLHLDNALLAQPEFLEECRRRGAQETDMRETGRRIRLWGTNSELGPLVRQLEETEKAQEDPVLCFTGSGDFNHITALLIARLAQRRSGKLTVLHFDNHPDWVRFKGGMHCGSWVNRALSLPGVQKVITIGVCSNDLRLPEWKGANLSLLDAGLLDLFPYRHAPSYVRHQYGNGPSYHQREHHLHWQTIEMIGEQAFLDLLLTRIGTEAVYVTIDKDVLAREDAITNWDQGMMRLPFLSEALRRIAERHRIAGADVVGDYSPPDYDGSWWTRTRKRGEILLDQPHRRPDAAVAASVNSVGNRVLLDAFSQVMA